MSNNAQKKMKQRSKRCWTGEEDEQLVQLVQIHGTGNWSVIAEQLGNRTGKQCRERWHNHLNPEVKKGEWSQDEDRIILQMQAKLGNQWAKITKMLPGRTDNAVKNRWHAAMRAQTRIMKNQDKANMYSSDSGASSPLSDASLPMDTKMPVPPLDLNKGSSPIMQQHKRQSPVMDFVLEPEASNKCFPVVDHPMRRGSAPQLRHMAHMQPMVAHSMPQNFAGQTMMMHAPQPQHQQAHHHHMARSLPDTHAGHLMNSLDALFMQECGTPTNPVFSGAPLERPLTPLDDDPAFEDWAAFFDGTDGETASDDSFSKRTHSSHHGSSLCDDELVNFDWGNVDMADCQHSLCGPMISPRSGQFDYPCNKRNCSRDKQDPTESATTVSQLLSAVDTDHAFFGGSAFSPVVPPL